MGQLFGGDEDEDEDEEGRDKPKPKIVEGVLPIQSPVKPPPGD